MLWMVKTVGIPWKRGVFVVEGAQQNGNQRGLPVVAVEDIGHAEDFCGLQNGAAIEGKALGIVMVIAERSAVESVTIVERRIINEVELDAVLLAAVEHRAEAVMVVKGNGDAGDDGARILQMGLPVERQVHCDLMAEFGDGARQGSDNVGKSSSFGKRNTLGCGKQDVHRASGKARTEVGCAAS